MSSSKVITVILIFFISVITLINTSLSALEGNSDASPSRDSGYSGSGCSSGYSSSYHSAHSRISSSSSNFHTPEAQEGRPTDMNQVVMKLTTLYGEDNVQESRNMMSDATSQTLQNTIDFWSKSNEENEQKEKERNDERFNTSISTCEEIDPDSTHNQNPHKNIFGQVIFSSKISDDRNRQQKLIDEADKHKRIEDRKKHKIDFLNENGTALNAAKKELKSKRPVAYGLAKTLKNVFPNYSSLMLGSSYIKAVLDHPVGGELEAQNSQSLNANAIPYSQNSAVNPQAKNRFSHLKFDENRQVISEPPKSVNGTIREAEDKNLPAFSDGTAKHRDSNATDGKLLIASSLTNSKANARQSTQKDQENDYADPYKRKKQHRIDKEEYKRKNPDYPKNKSKLRDSLKRGAIALLMATQGITSADARAIEVPAVRGADTQAISENHPWTSTERRPEINPFSRRLTNQAMGFDEAIDSKFSDTLKRNSHLYTTTVASRNKPVKPKTGSEIRRERRERREVTGCRNYCSNTANANQACAINLATCNKNRIADAMQLGKCQMAGEIAFKNMPKLTQKNNCDLHIKKNPSMCAPRIECENANKQLNRQQAKTKLTNDQQASVISQLQHKLQASAKSKADAEATADAAADAAAVATAEAKASAKAEATATAAAAGLGIFGAASAAAAALMKRKQDQANEESGENKEEKAKRKQEMEMAKLKYKQQVNLLKLNLTKPGNEYYADSSGEEGMRLLNRKRQLNRRTSI